MSGHSKWHKIRHKKGAADAKRSNLFTKLTRAVTIAAQQGGGDPDMNFSLRMAIDKAKAGNVPKDNIDRAIKRGTGELKDAAAVEEVLYEGFGPGGVGILIDVLTDNKNRAVGEIKHVLSRFGGSLGGPGSVQWQFSRLGVARLAASQKSKIKNLKSDFELALIDAGADDIIEMEEGIEVRCAMDKLQNVIEAVKKFDIEIEDSGLEWVAKEEIELDEEKSKSVEKLYDALDELDDVRGVYTNEK